MINIITLFDLEKIMVSKYKKTILDYIEEAGKATSDELQETFQISRSVVFNVTDELIREGNLRKKRIDDRLYYYKPAKTTWGDLEDANNKIKESIIVAEDSSDMLVKEVDQLRGEIKSIYANIISLMSIFVAIFALIIANVNVIAGLVDTNISKLLVGIIAVNVSIGICIAVFIILIRIFIINPLKK